MPTLNRQFNNFWKKYKKIGIAKTTGNKEEEPTYY